MRILGLRDLATAGLGRRLLRHLVFAALAVLCFTPIRSFDLMATVAMLIGVRVVLDLLLLWSRRRPFDAELIDLLTNGALFWLFVQRVDLPPPAEAFAYVLPLVANLGVLKFVTLLAGLVAVSWGGDRLVRTFFTQYSRDALDSAETKLQQPDTLGTGRLIGIVERLLIMLLAVAGQYGAIGFVLAAKSIARFKKLDDQQFAEYYLLGTLLSALIALLVAWGIIAVQRVV